MITMVLRKKGSREPRLVRMYHLSVEWDLLSMQLEFTSYSFEAEVFFSEQLGMHEYLCGLVFYLNGSLFNV